MEKTNKEFIKFTFIHMVLITISFIIAMISAIIVQEYDLGVLTGMVAIAYTFMLSILRFWLGSNNK